MVRPLCPTARAHMGWGLLQHPGGREGRGAWRRALRGSVLEGREGRCSSRLWAPGWSRTGEAQLHSPHHGHGGQPSSRPALGLGGCPHQALSNQVCLICLGQVAELPPLQELCTGDEGVPRGLQRSRGWEMAPQPRQGDLAYFSSQPDSEPFPAPYGKRQRGTESELGSVPRAGTRGSHHLRYLTLPASRTEILKSC